MKRTTLKSLIAAIILSVFCLGNWNACDAQTLTEVVETLHESLPISLGQMGEITSISVSGGNLLMECSVDDDVVDIPGLKSQPELMKENMRQWLLGGDSQYGMFFDAISNEGLGLKIQYTGKKTGNQVSCELTNAEIKDRKAHLSEYNPKKQLDFQIEAANKQLPTDEGEGLICTKVVRKGKYVVYYFSCDEATVDMNLMKKLRPTMHAMSLASLNSDEDVSISQFRRSCKRANVGVAYYYIGNKSGKTVKVLIPAKELR